jgi:hypothetical protein
MCTDWRLISLAWKKKLLFSDPSATNTQTPQPRTGLTTPGCPLAFPLLVRRITNKTLLSFFCLLLDFLPLCMLRPVPSYFQQTVNSLIACTPHCLATVLQCSKYQHISHDMQQQTLYIERYEDMRKTVTLFFKSWIQLLLLLLLLLLLQYSSLFQSLQNKQNTIFILFFITIQYVSSIVFTPQRLK